MGYDKRAGKGGTRLGASFTVFRIAKCMHTNKVADRSGCPVSNPDPNNTIGLLRLNPCVCYIVTRSTSPPGKSTVPRGHSVKVIHAKLVKTFSTTTHHAENSSWFAKVHA